MTRTRKLPIALALACSLAAQAPGFARLSATQNAPSADVYITSAIFGAALGSADVTPIVTALAKPGLDEFYAAPRWLEVDPVVGETKQLVIFYEYRGEPHVFTTAEPGAVSQAILLEHADPARRQAVPANVSPGSLLIVNAYYGSGAMFVPVTAVATQLLGPDSPPFVVDDVVMGVRATAANKVLIVTYTYGDVRNTVVAWRGSRLSAPALFADAASGRFNRPRVDTPPQWFASAHPDAPRAPGNPGPGIGRSPRRELGIGELLRALAELEAVAADARGEALTIALRLATGALDAAQRDMRYVYPPAGSPALKALDATRTAHVANATAFLTSALTQFSSATPRTLELSTCIGQIRDALTALQQPQ